MNIHDREKALYARILWMQDFDVPRSDDYPSSTWPARGKSRQLTAAETARWHAAREFCPWWFRDSRTNYLEDLDRLVLITDQGIEEANAPIVCIKPSYTAFGESCGCDCCVTHLLFEDGEYDLITDWDTPIHDEDGWRKCCSPEARLSRGYDYLPNLGRKFHTLFPTATNGLALRKLTPTKRTHNEM